MKIIKEGTITITPEGGYRIENFHVVEGTLEDLEREALRRIKIAAASTPGFTSCRIEVLMPPDDGEPAANEDGDFTHHG